MDAQIAANEIAAVSATAAAWEDALLALGTVELVVAVGATTVAVEAVEVHAQMDAVEHALKADAALFALVAVELHAVEVAEQHAHKAAAAVESNATTHAQLLVAATYVLQHAVLVATVAAALLV